MDVRHTLTALTLTLLCTITPLLSQTAAAQIPTASEAADLAFMREEEKMARDLYRAFFAAWDNDIFANIAASEQRHMDAVLGLLTLYGLTDPAAGQPEGQFTNGDVQALYDSLLDQGMASEIAALEAAQLVEETDIADLESAIAGTGNTAILRVYRNLLKGSQNHLAAFTNRLLQLDSSATGGSSAGPGEGVSVFEPLSQTLYIPALDVTTKNGTTQVYDAYLRVVESLPVTLELLTVTLTDKTPNVQHASINLGEGILDIPQLSIGSRQVDSLDGNIYIAEFTLLNTGSAITFVLQTLTP